MLAHWLLAVLVRVSSSRKLKKSVEVNSKKPCSASLVFQFHNDFETLLPRQAGLGLF